MTKQKKSLEKRKILNIKKKLLLCVRLFFDTKKKIQKNGKKKVEIVK